MIERTSKKCFVTIYTSRPGFVIGKKGSDIEKIKNKEIEPDFVSALKLCKRRRIGAIRPNANRELFYKKDMGILARGGFSFDLSKRILNLDIDEFNKLLKII